MRIKDKIKRPRRPVVVYEILPPREKDGTLNSYAANISSLLSQTHIDAINIPEVRDEIARGERPIKINSGLSQENLENYCRILLELSLLLTGSWCTKLLIRR